MSEGAMPENALEQEILISFQDFTFQYRSQSEPTLKNVSLDIRKGERVIIIGASGSGKSTLAHCLNGLIPSCYPGEARGNLHICGREAGRLGIFDLSRYVGTVLQDTDGQFIGMTVLEDIAFSPENDCVPQDELIRRTREEARKVNLVEKLDAAPHELSGGQKQRVSLAGVLINRIPILLFDEPLANLDPRAGKQTIELIDEIQQNSDTTVIIIEHRLEDALHMGADRIVLMEDGKIVSDTPPTRLFLSDRLSRAGIREPLFITALKYAGCEMTQDMELQRIQDLRLCEEQRQRVERWFREAGRKEPGPPRETILRVENLSFSYTGDKDNLSNVNFEIGAGEMVSIVGKNGAGKSTLAKLLCGFEKLDRGTVLLKGRDIADDTIKERARYIGYVMQNPNQMISKPFIFDEVAMSLLIQGLSEEEIRERVWDTLKICGLYEFRNWPISALSYGQKKRVTIACILVQRPDILILDEPTAGQDFRHYTEIMDFLKGLNQQGITVIMITHDMHLMLEYTPRTMVFSEGRLLADTTPVKLFADEKLVERASLKETSLFGLANLCGLDPEAYIDAFIEYDRQVRE